MRFFRQRDQGEEWENLHHRLAHSFANVKDDISTINRTIQSYQQWVQYLYQRIQSQESHIQSLVHQLNYVPKSHADIKKVIDDNYRFEDLLRRVEELHKKVDGVLDTHRPMLERMETHHERLSALESGQQEKRPNFREKIIQKITKNSKEYVKGLMLSLIRKYERISAMQLREIVVEEQGLCSRSSFYRLLSELEQSNEMEILEDGKEKFCVSKMYSTKHHP